MSKLFVSYSSKDRDRIAQLVAALEARGHDVWWDSKIGGATRFSTEIEAALDEADATIVAWSPAAVTSEWVLDEAAHARDHDKLVPIRLDDVFPPLGFRQRQAIDFSAWDGTADSPQMDELETALDRVGSGKIGDYAAESRTIVHEHKGLLSHRQLIAALLSLLSVSALVFYVWQDHRGEVEARSLKSDPYENVVAILPFSGDREGDDERVVAGMYEGIVSKLSKVDGLTILSPLALTRYVEEVPPLDEIAAATGARYVMLGNFERTGETLRLSLQLADATLGTNVWSNDQVATATLESMHDAQFEIAETVARQLKAALDDDERSRVQRAPTLNRQAYDDYLIGIGMLESDPDPMRYLNRRSEALERAVEADPDFVEAIAALAMVRMMKSRTGPAATPREQEATRIAIERALQQAQMLDPEAAETLMAEGYYHLWVTRNFSAAESLLGRALRLAPSVQVAAFGYGWAARRNGRFEESIAALERAAKLDPFAYQPMRDLSWSLAAMGRNEEAWTYFEKARSLAPAPSFQATHEARLHLMEGDSSAALASFDGVDAGPDTLAHIVLTEIAIDVGDREAIDAALENWASAFDSNGPFGLFFQVRRAESAERLGDAAMLADARARLAASVASPERGQPAVWGIPLSPVTIPSFLGNEEEVDRLIADYEKRDDIDQWLGLLVDRRQIAEAFMRLGATERALDQLEEITTGLGAKAFHSFSYEPLFLPLRSSPRWRAMRAAANNAA
ncbi:TIR domain-containing protein [Sphingomicrobium marinum]|uniref:TIR domain-containing protein n=1 Tax=Sphingomicrobium marinum TaxID=1227950 RepID=UPI00223F9814|nr:TIR domain-containing protein [Sphingomicrobium marinum]